MINRLIETISRKVTDNLMISLKDQQNSRTFLQAKSLIAHHQSTSDLIKNDLKKAEFKVYSQWGDDGIIQFLINYLDIEDHSFVEFGVENYTEANTRFLLENDNWRGLIMDGGAENMASIRKDNIYWRHELTAVNAFIDKKNINDLMRSNGFSGQLGILHIDVDGNDYWLWNEVEAVDPQIVIVEYNSLFGPTHRWTVPYAADFIRTNAHFSNLYYGVSIGALVDLGQEKGYAFVGCNSNGNNAYFVRNDKLKDLKVLTAEEGYVRSRFREGRNQEGKLTFDDFEKRFEAILGLKVIETSSGKSVRIETKV